MGWPRGAKATALLHHGQRSRRGRDGFDFGLPLPRLARRRDRARRWHHRHRQCGPLAACHQDRHRHLSEAAAGPISEYFPKVPVEVGNELFWYTFDGEPVAKDGFIDLSDTAPGFGLTLKPVDANFKLTR
jgi:hypothetical protein